MELLKGTFKNQIQPDDTKPDAKTEYENKAKESIGGSMVFVERKKLVWDSPK